MIALYIIGTLTHFFALVLKSNRSQMFDIYIRAYFKQVSHKLQQKYETACFINLWTTWPHTPHHHRDFSHPIPTEPSRFNHRYNKQIIFRKESKSWLERCNVGGVSSINMHFVCPPPPPPCFIYLYKKLLNTFHSHRFVISATARRRQLVGDKG